MEFEFTNKVNFVINLKLYLHIQNIYLTYFYGCVMMNTYLGISSYLLFCCMMKGMWGRNNLVKRYPNKFSVSMCQ